MKKSAIYLGASAAILAIAGAFTTKANTKVETIPAYTYGGTFVTNATCDPGGAKTCITEGGTKLYTGFHGLTLRTIVE